MSNDSSSTSNAPLVPTELPADVKAPEKPHWGPIAAVLYSFLAFIGAQVVAYMVLMVATSIFQYDTSAFIETIAGQFAFILLAELATVAAIIGYVKLRRGTLAELGITRLKLRYGPYALAGYGVYFVSYLVLIALVSILVPSINLEQEQNIGFNDPLGTWELVLTFISLVVLPPLAEEILFRGFMFKGLRTKFPFIVAAVVTSLLFAVGHLEFGGGQPLLWVAGIDTFILSLVLCYIRERTGSIWTGIFIHALKNAVAFSVLYIFVS